jgi:hypothetical protein
MGFENFMSMGIPAALSKEATFARCWSEATLRQCDRYEDARKNYANTMRMTEKMALDIPVEPARLERAWRRVWAEGHLLAISAQQLENWLCRYNEECEAGGEVAEGSVEFLKHLRNALEHLNEADISGSGATMVAGTKHYSLKKLPGKSLPTSIHVGAAKTQPFGVISIESLRELATQVETAIEDAEDSMAESWSAWDA